jgi:hypothetical protein
MQLGSELEVAATVYRRAGGGGERKEIKNK